MKRLVRLIPKTIPAFIVVSITLLTLGTSVFGAAKIIQNLGSHKIETAETLQTQNEEANQTIAQNSSDPPTPTSTTSQKTNPNPPPSTSVRTTQPLKQNVSLPTVNNQPQTVPSNQCIITLFGQQYDVATLQSTHSGGNVFNCGTDMTTVYQQKHGTNVSMMQPYLVTNTVGTTGSTSNPPPATNNPSPTSKPRHDDDDD